MGNFGLLQLDPQWSLRELQHFVLSDLCDLRSQTSELPNPFVHVLNFKKAR